MIFTAAGLLYGLVLAFFGLGVANGGDGVMIPLYVFGSPLFFPLLFLAPVVLWVPFQLFVIWWVDYATGQRWFAGRSGLLLLVAALASAEVLCVPPWAPLPAA